MAGSRIEVQRLKQQEPSEDGKSFPGHGKRVDGKEPPKDSINQKLPQVNTARQDQVGGGGIRIRENNITAHPKAQSVGASNCGNRQVEEEGSGGGLEIRGNTITAGEGASGVGFHNIGNTTSAGSVDPVVSRKRS